MNLLTYFFNISFNPIDLKIIVLIFVLFVLILLSALISASETAFFSLSPSEINSLKSEKSKKAKNILILLAKPKHLIANILIANNFINVAIIILFAFIIKNLINFNNHKILIFVFQTVIITAVLLLLSEIMPKIYASYNALNFSKKIINFIMFIAFIFNPLAVLLVRTSSLIDKRIARKDYNISIPELSKAIEITTKKAENEEDQQYILQGIVNFVDIEVREIMKSRMDIAAVELETNFNNLLMFIQQAGYSRIPVYKGTLDNIVGILYIKDLLPVMEESESYNWKNLLRPAFFVPENKKISDLLKEFRENKIHMAIIVDEYGGTSGLITLEDILEEIVGEIMDESDEIDNEILYTKINDNTFIFEGKTSINDFCKIVNIEENLFDEVRGEADSIAGLLLEIEGEIPPKNKEIQYKNFVFTIEAVDKRRIKLIKVNILRNDSNP